MTVRFRNLVLPFVPGLVIAACLLAGQARALAGDLSLSDAVAAAVANNPGLRAVGFQALSAEEKILQAKSGYMPQVRLAAQYSQTTNPMWAFGTKLNQESITSMDFDPDLLNDPDSITNYSSVLSVSWPVYDSGQTWYGLQQARMNRESAALMEKRTLQQVIAGTISAYIGTLLAREHQAVLQQILETASSHLKLVRSRYEGGFVAKSDLLRAQVHIADLEQQLTEARSQTDIARCRLNVSMGIGGNLMYTLTTPLEPGDALPGTLESWISKALATRPDLQQMVFQKHIAEKEIDKSKASRHPSVSLAGNYEINSESFDDSGSNYTVGAVVSVPLFTGGRISARIREAEVNLQQISALVQAMEHQVCAETRQAFFNAQSAWNRINVARSAVSQSEESLRIVRNRYNSGLFTITDLLDADVMVQQSLTNQLKAIHGYREAIARLELAAGTIQEPGVH